MSYILDALQKSEAARRRQEGPDLSLLEPVTSSPDARSANHHLAWWLAAAVGLNVLLLAAFWQYYQSGPGASATTADLPQQQPAAVDAKAGAPAAEPIPPPAVTTVSDASLEPTLTASEPTPETLNLNTHIYAAEAAYREVSFNGRFYRIGDQVGPAVLEDITATGARLRYQGRIIELAVGDSWRP